MTTCSICERPRYCKGFCKLHYDRSRIGADMLAPYQPHSPAGTSAYDKVMAMSVWDGDCFVFNRATNEGGYGRIGIPGTDRAMLAHRAVMEHHYGKSDLEVLHSCDNPPCVRIEHLSYGTRLDNNTDAITKGRQRGRALADEEVEAIRVDPRRQVDIAADYGISQAHVSRIKTGSRRR